MDLSHLSPEEPSPEGPIPEAAPPEIIERLRAVGLRPTRQRLALTQLLFNRGDRHVTAEQLHGEALASAIPVSLATVYNTLHQFTAAGLLREVVVEPGRSYFDTNIDAPSGVVGPISWDE
jgi:Fe2+ or Zn2+ uptake regulation protein